MISLIQHLLPPEWRVPNSQGKTRSKDWHLPGCEHFDKNLGGFCLRKNGANLDFGNFWFPPSCQAFFLNADILKDMVYSFFYLCGQKDFFFPFFGGVLLHFLRNPWISVCHSNTPPWTLPGREDPRAHCGTPADSPGWKGGFPKDAAAVFMLQTNPAKSPV